MAGEREHTETETHTEGTNGASRSRAAMHAATLAALEAGEHELDDGAGAGTADRDDDDAPAKKPAAKKPNDEGADDDDLEDDDEDEDLDADDAEETDSEDDDDIDEDDDDDQEDDEEEVEKDPDLAKRLARVQKAERRSKEQLEAQKKQFEADRDAFVAEWKPKVEKAERIERLAAGGAHNIVEIMRELGISEDDYELAGQIAYGHSKKAASDPKEAAKYKEAIARSKREREQATEIEQLKKRLDEKEQRETSAAEQQRLVAEGAAYLDGVMRAAKKLAEKYPLAAKLATAKNGGNLAQRQFAAIAVELTEKLGARPSRERVLRLYEKRKARELKALGHDVGADKGKPGKADAKSGKGKDEKKPAGDGKPKTRREQLAETRRLLESGEITLD